MISDHEFQQKQTACQSTTGIPESSKEAVRPAKHCSSGSTGRADSASVRRFCRGRVTILATGRHQADDIGRAVAEAARVRRPEGPAGRPENGLLAEKTAIGDRHMRLPPAFLELCTFYAAIVGTRSCRRQTANWLRGPRSGDHSDNCSTSDRLVLDVLRTQRVISHLADTDVWFHNL